MLNIAVSQDFEVPEYELEAAEDYAEYEDDVIAGFNWLVSNAPDHEVAKRAEVSKFLLAWMTGSPNVSIVIDAEVLTFMNSSPTMLVVFLGGWTKYALENDAYDDAYQGSLAGLNAVVAYYSAYKDKLGKDKNIEKYVKMKSKGKLEAFVKSKT